MTEMGLRYLLDENQRGVLWRMIERHNARGMDPLDAVRVGDSDDLPLGSSDPDILIWAEREGRVLVTLDRDTMATHLANHLSAGRHSPGIFMMRNVRLKLLLDFLVLAAYCSKPEEWRDRIAYAP